MHYKTDALFDALYWLINIVPSQVPESRAEEYFALEREYRQTEKLAQLYALFAGLLTLVSERYDAVLLTFPQNQTTEKPSERQITDAVQTHKRRGAVQLFLPKEETLFTLDAEDLHMTVYLPKKELLTFLKEEAAKRNLYLWRHTD